MGAGKKYIQFGKKLLSSEGEEKASRKIKSGGFFVTTFFRAFFSDSELNCAAVSFRHDGWINILNVVSPFRSSLKLYRTTCGTRIHLA